MSLWLWDVLSIQEELLSSKPEDLSLKGLQPLKSDSQLCVGSLQRLSCSVFTSFMLHCVPAGSHDAHYCHSAFTSKEVVCFLRSLTYSLSLHCAKKEMGSFSCCCFGFCPCWCKISCSAEGNLLNVKNEMRVGRLGHVFTPTRWTFHPRSNTHHIHSAAVSLFTGKYSYIISAISSSSHITCVTVLRWGVYWDISLNVCTKFLCNLSDLCWFRAFIWPEVCLWFT